MVKETSEKRILEVAKKHFVRFGFAAAFAIVKIKF